MRTVELAGVLPLPAMKHRHFRNQNRGFAIMVIWTIQARRQLRHSLAKALCAHNEKSNGYCLKPVKDKMKTLDEILSCTFPNAKSIVVRDQMIGFRRKHENYILLVEVDQLQRGGPYVVKIGLAEKMLQELKGWECCRPVGLQHDLVLLPLAQGCAIPEDQPEWISLVYGDAQQFIGVERTVSFEEAFLNAVQYGNPTLESIAFVLVELLERLGHLLYTTSFVEDPAAADYVFRIPKVVSGIDLWKTDHLAIRSYANELVNHGVTRFIDPVDYFEQWILPHFPYEFAGSDGLATRLPSRDRQSRSQDIGQAGATEGNVLEPIPEAYDLVPYMLRGCAHGDLHGRNILVGLVHTRALWPTVYDYEDMGPCNLCGWDFVKLEMELKIRAYDRILPSDKLKHLKAIRDSELRLNEMTEQHHADGSWPFVAEHADPVERLHAAVLEIRRMAAVHLGMHRGRPRQWLEEYYFLMAAYSINAANYSNLQERELIASYVAGGVAASRLSWPRRREPWERRRIGL